VSTLYVVATPIGNGADISARALDVLRKVSMVACEDTRTARVLLAILGVPAPQLISLFEHNEEARVAQVVAALEDGRDVALISEAGTPTISDPGYRLVNRCIERGIRVSPIPGPCAAIAALCASGLPTDRFLFLGFAPKKGGKLAEFVAEAVAPARTSIMYVPARKAPDLVSAIAAAAPQARVVVARELTKTFEEFLRGKPAEVLALLTAEKLRGEVIVLCYVE